MIQKAFEIGNSTALTIPKKSGIKPGTKVIFKQEEDKLIYEIVDAHYINLQEKRIRDTSGAFMSNTPNVKKILKALKENSYDSKIRIS